MSCRDILYLPILLWLFYYSWFLLPKPKTFTVFYFMLLAVDLFSSSKPTFYVTLWFFTVRLSETDRYFFAAVVLVC